MLFQPKKPAFCTLFFAFCCFLVVLLGRLRTKSWAINYDAIIIVQSSKIFVFIIF